MTTLQTYINAIQVNYPEAGIDNDSQGFRDNFSNIAGGLQKVQDDLAIVQTNAVSVATLDGQNDPVDNNLLGSTIRNGIYNTLRGAVRNGGTINGGVTDIDYNLGALQIFSINDTGVVLRFTNWPDDGQYAKIKVHMRNAGTGTARTVTLSTEGGGDLVYQNAFPTLTVATTQKHLVIEAWTYNAGADVYVRYLGEY
jgi:hypothetical protein